MGKTCVWWVGWKTCLFNPLQCRWTDSPRLLFFFHLLEKSSISCFNLAKPTAIISAFKSPSTSTSLYPKKQKKKKTSLTSLRRTSFQVNRSYKLTSMQDSSNFARAFGKSFALQLTGQLMVIAILVLFVIVVFVILLHLYAKFFWLHPEEVETTSETHRRRLPSHRSLFATGLDLTVLNSLPVMEIGSDNFKDGMECAVCLSDVVDGQRARVLPKCNHGFHLNCIDMWFQFHSTCPLCRDDVALDHTDYMGSPLRVDIEAQTETSSSSGVPSESLNMPTNVLFWGNQRDESPSSSRESNGSLVIEIPNEASPPTSSFSSTSSPTGRRVAEEAKSLVATRLRSLKRILSRETGLFPCNCTATS